MLTNRYGGEAGGGGSGRGVIDNQREKVSRIIVELLGRRATDLEVLKAGRNSQVWKAEMGQEAYVVKCYYRPPCDPRDRLGVEWQALQLMHVNQIYCVPAPLVSSRRHELAIYEYIPGRPALEDPITHEDAVQAARFLARLDELKAVPAAEELGLASDGNLCLRQALENLERRLRRLRLESMGTLLQQELEIFLTGTFEPLYQEIIAKSRRSAEEAGVPWDRVLPPEERALSPSDFGFHNVIRRADGTLAFVDFEYFGWDDPAKMVVDFLYHPGQELSQEHQRGFLLELRRLLPWPYDLDRRLRVAWSLCGMNWCLILLNELRPEVLARRKFAGEDSITVHLQMRQLERARAVLERSREVPHGLLEAF